MTYTKEQRQEILNVSTAGVLAQGRPALHNTKGGCAYRAFGPNGVIKCGIGHLIPDDKFQAMQKNHTDGMYASALVRDEIDFMPEHLRPQKVAADIDFLRIVQGCHDNAWSTTRPALETFVEDFKARVRDVAKNWDLEIPEGCRE